MSKPSGIANLHYGVEVIHGLMGAGKSFFAVRRCVRVVLETRRPLYTNLPLKFKVVRAYLKIKGGPEVVNLIRRLDERHWRAFLKRQHDFAKFREGLAKRTPADLPAAEFAEFADAIGMDQDKARRLPKFFDRHVGAWFVVKNGPHIIDGPEANWIPPTAIIAIDEVQHWHPMTRQGNDPSREDLLAYLTMIRHHVQWLWVITQDASRIAIEFRLLARYFWRVWDRGEDRLAWGIRFKHLGVKAMGYECATKDQLENKDPENARPVERFTIIPAFKWNQVLFRLYSSHTNVASPRAILRDLRRAREAAGLHHTGHSEYEVQAMQAPAPKASLFRRVLRFLRRGVVLGIVGLAAYAIGTATAEPPATQTEITQDEKEPEPIVWPRWTAAGSSPWIDGKRIRQGERLSERILLEHVDPGGRQLVLRVDDAEWWLWKWPEAEPARVGTIEDVRSAVERLGVSLGTGGPTSVPGS